MDDASKLTLEAQVCRLSDAVAYLNHDIGDAIRAGILLEEELPPQAREVLGTDHSQRIDTMVRDVIEASWLCTGEGARTDEPHPHVGMTSEVAEAVLELREFMFEQVYIPIGDGPETTHARGIVEFLYDYYTRHPEKIPLERVTYGESPERRAVDYIAGMTDNYAIQVWEMLNPGMSGGILGMRR